MVSPKALRTVEAQYCFMVHLNPLAYSSIGSLLRFAGCLPSGLWLATVRLDDRQRCLVRGMFLGRVVDLLLILTKCKYHFVSRPAS